MQIIKLLSVSALALWLCAMTLSPVQAETPASAAKAMPSAGTSHRLVIQVNKGEKELQDHVLSSIVNLQKFYGMDDIEMEVVAYGPGIWLVTEKSAFRQRVESLLLQNVTFTACGNTLAAIEAKAGKRPKLLDGVKETEAGISRLIELQEKGWSYLSP